MHHPSMSASSGWVAHCEHPTVVLLSVKKKDNLLQVRHLGERAFASRTEEITFGSIREEREGGRQKAAVKRDLEE